MEGISAGIGGIIADFRSLIPGLSQLLFTNIQINIMTVLYHGIFKMVPIGISLLGKAVNGFFINLLNIIKISYNHGYIAYGKDNQQKSNGQQKVPEFSSFPQNKIENKKQGSGN